MDDKQNGQTASVSLFDEQSSATHQWNTVMAALSHRYNRENSGNFSLASIEPNSYLPGIEHGIDLTSGRYRDGTLVGTRSDDFRSFHVEALLDQAAGLFERGLRDRSEWDELSIREYELLLDIQQYKAIEDIHKEETNHTPGYYDWQAKESTSNAQAEQSVLEGTGSAKTALEDVARYCSEHNNSLLNHNKTAACPLCL